MCPGSTACPRARCRLRSTCATPRRPDPMSLYNRLQQRAAEGRPIRIGLIGAGKFGAMYLAQIPRTPGVQLVAIADLSPDAARVNLARVGWKPERSAAGSVQEALKTGATWI